MPAARPAIPGRTPPRPRDSLIMVTSERAMNATSAARRGPSHAGSAVTGDPAAIDGRPVSDSHVSTAKAAAQKAVNARYPFVASVRRRASATTVNDPTARLARTVQLISARLEAIWSAGTAGV